MLDAGAGEGQYRHLFTRHRWIGADLAIGDAGWDYTGLSTICDLHRMPFADGSFDAAVARVGFEVESVEPQGGYFWHMGDRLQPMHRYVFSNRRRWWWKVLFAPLEFFSKIFFSIFVPLIAYRLDKWDRKKNYTTGFEAVAVRPEVGA